MNICIASRSRSHIIDKQLGKLHPDLYSCITVYVPESQVEQYRKAIYVIGKNREQIKLRCVPDEWVLAPIRSHMAEQSVAAGHSSIIMVDDDLRYIMRREHTSWHTKVQSHSDTVDMFTTIDRLLEDGHWGHIAIAPRLMQQARPIGGPNDVVAECQRAMCIVGWRLDDFFNIDYKRMKARSDFDGTLQSLRLGRPNLILGYWICDQLKTDMAGGCADYRTAAMFDETARQLADYHPGLVKLVQKKNKIGVITERTEVVIRWRKALGYG